MSLKGSMSSNISPCFSLSRSEELILFDLSPGNVLTINKTWSLGVSFDFDRKDSIGFKNDRLVVKTKKKGILRFHVHNIQTA